MGLRLDGVKRTKGRRGQVLKDKFDQLEKLCGREGPHDVKRVKILKKEVGLLLEQENMKWKHRAK